MGFGLILFVLAALEFRACRANIGSEYNGYGAIQGVLARTGHAPGRYRVLVPWLVCWLPVRWRLVSYLAHKWGLMGLSLVVARSLVGESGALALGLLMAATFEFDYWDCYAELLGVGLCLSGEPWQVLVGVVVWGVSRETVFLAVPLAFLSGGWEAGIASLAGVVVWWLIRQYQGKADLYSGRWKMRKSRLGAWRGLKGKVPGWRYWLGVVAIGTINPYNATDLRRAWDHKDTGVLLSVVFTLAGVGTALFSRANMGPALARTAWIGLGWLVAGWTLARARETRLFLPVGLWIVGGL